jgi:hypothetical protein
MPAARTSFSGTFASIQRTYFYASFDVAIEDNRVGVVEGGIFSHFRR